MKWLFCVISFSSEKRCVCKFIHTIFIYFCIFSKCFYSFLWSLIYLYFNQTVTIEIFTSLKDYTSFTMLKKSLVILALLNCIISNAQSGEKERSNKYNGFKDIVFAPGLIVQHETFLEFNMLFGNVTVIDGKIPVIGVDGFRIGFETNLRDGHNHTIAPKIGYEISATVFMVRLSAINYFQNKNSEFRLLPEIGISMLGWVNLTYGYGIPFNNGNLNNVSHHRVGLSFNLDRRLKAALFDGF